MAYGFNADKSKADLVKVKTLTFPSNTTWKTIYSSIYEEVKDNLANLLYVDITSNNIKTRYYLTLDRRNNHEYTKKIGLVFASNAAYTRVQSSGVIKKEEVFIDVRANADYTTETDDCIGVVLESTGEAPYGIMGNTSVTAWRAYEATFSAVTVNIATIS